MRDRVRYPRKRRRFSYHIQHFLLLSQHGSPAIPDQKPEDLDQDAFCFFAAWSGQPKILSRIFFAGTALTGVFASVQWPFLCPTQCGRDCRACDV